MPFPPLFTYTLVSSGVATFKSWVDSVLRSKDKKFEAEEAYWRRLEEVEYKARLDEQAQERGHLYRVREAWISGQINLRKDLIIRQVAHEQATELELLRHRLALEATVVNRFLKDSEDNSPFKKPSQETIGYLRGEYECNTKPLALIAPFWNDKRTNRENDEGGDWLDYRIAISNSVKNFPGIVKCDGYLRPLRDEDLDVAKISSALFDVPTILIYGKVEGNQRVHPAITVWNLIPGTEGRYFQLILDFLEIQKYKPEKEEGRFQDFVADYIATVVFLLSDAYHSFKSQNNLFSQLYSESFLNRLSLEAEELSKLGFNKIEFDPVGDGYGLSLKLLRGLMMFFWLPPEYPKKAPKIFLKRPLGEREPVEFGANAWQPEVTLAEVVQALCESFDMTVIVPDRSR